MGSIIETNKNATISQTSYIRPIPDKLLYYLDRGSQMEDRRRYSYYPRFFITKEKKDSMVSARQ